MCRSNVLRHLLVTGRESHHAALRARHRLLSVVHHYHARARAPAREASVAKRRALAWPEANEEVMARGNYKHSSKGAGIALHHHLFGSSAAIRKIALAALAPAAGHRWRLSRGVGYNGGRQLIM